MRFLEAVSTWAEPDSGHISKSLESCRFHASGEGIDSIGRQGMCVFTYTADSGVTARNPEREAASAALRELD